MSTTPHSHSSASSGDDRNLVSIDENYLAPTFEDRLRLFWAKNNRLVLASCAVVLVGILVKGGYGIIAEQREKTIAADYAAATNDAQLKAFVASHETHVLGGLAELRLADQAYAASSYSEGRTLYAHAAGILKDTTFGQRAQLGGAICAIKAGAVSDGEAALKQIAADLTAAKMVRAEAAYHLASQAVASANSVEALRYIEQATSIDPDGQWAERATMLRTVLPQSVTVSPSSDAKKDGVPAISFK